MDADSKKAGKRDREDKLVRGATKRTREGRNKKQKHVGDRGGQRAEDNMDEIVDLKHFRTRDHTITPREANQH